MLKVFVLQNQSVSSQYGIGNYIHILREYYIKLNYKLFFINLFVIDKKEVCVKKNLDSFMEIYIPYNSSHRATFHDNDYSKVSKYICYILKQYITSSDKVIFHLNSSSNFGLANSLKRYFPKSRTLLTIHYTNWAFILKGNTQWLNEIIRKKHTIDPIETKVIDSVKADINTFNCCDKIICIAEHSYDFLRKTCAINEDKIVLINNAIHDTYKQDNCQLKKNLRTKFFIPEKVDILLYVGRIDDNKGLSFLLSTFSKIICEQPNVHLVLAGDGNISECLKSAYPFWHKITFLGYIDKVVLEEIYSIADIGIICSLFEEFGYVAIEMMMHKLPIVTTDTGGLSEIFEDNYNCLKVPLTRNNNEAFIDTNILKQKINQILTNKVLAKKLGDNARKDFLKKYEYNVWENKMNFFIKTLQS